MTSCLVGSTAVGKTSLYTQFFTGKFSSATMVSVSVDQDRKAIDVDGKSVMVNVWDTAGQERYNSITRAYFRNVHAVVVVYDITSRKSFGRVPMWLEEVRQHGRPDVLIALVGNKMDLRDAREVPELEAKEFAKEQGLLFREVSCKLNVGIHDVFADLAAKHIRHQQGNQSPRPQGANIANPGEPKQSSCC